MIIVSLHSIGLRIRVKEVWRHASLTNESDKVTEREREKGSGAHHEFGKRECFGWSKGRQRASSDAWVLFTHGSCEKRVAIYSWRFMSNILLWVSANSPALVQCQRHPRVSNTHSVLQYALATSLVMNTNHLTLHLISFFIPHTPPSAAFPPKLNHFLFLKNTYLI